MTTTTTKTHTLSAPYAMRTHSGLVSCSPFTSYFGLFRDASPLEASKDGWETFTADSLESYFTNGISAFSRRLEHLKDLKAPYTQEHATEMLFMLESLVYARQLLAEI
jgi:hypothetical protein